MEPWVMLIVTASLALATEASFLDVPYSSERLDAPTDGVVLLEAAGIDAVATLSVDGAAPVVLDAVPYTGEWSRLPLYSISPPATGWPTDTPLVLDVTTPFQDVDASQSSFSFQAVDQRAPVPGIAQVLGVTTTRWSDDTLYPWGCCRPVRTVEIHVDVPVEDAWAGVELIGRYAFSQPSQIDEDPSYSRLDLQLGGGERLLRAVQWNDSDDGIQPPCFEVRVRNAAGALGGPVEVCAERHTTVDGSRVSTGCTTGAAARPAWRELLALWGRARR